MFDQAAELMNQADRAPKEHRMADAERDLAAAVGLCRADGARRELAQALRKLGEIKRDLKQGEAARALYEEAVSIYREEGSPLELAHTIRHLGDIHRHEGHAQLAEICYLEALALYRNQPAAAPLDLANAIRPLAIIRHDAGQLAQRHEST
jgi:tetratricopeptide (TPR) repeat protein